MIRWLVVLTLHIKNKITVQGSVRLTRLPKWHPVISLAPIFSKLRDHQIPDLRLHDHPSENFSSVGYKKESVRKGESWFSLRASRPLFPLINFLFLPDCLACSLFLCTHLNSRYFAKVLSVFVFSCFRRPLLSSFFPLLSLVY